jgi:hypothetical protein
MGHVNRKTPAYHYTFRGRHENGHASPTMAGSPGEGALANARLHAHLTTTSTLSQTSAFAQPTLHFIVSMTRPKNIEVGTNTSYTGQAIHRRLTANAWEGSTLLKFLYGQLYNSKLAKRYGRTRTDECPLCHKPDSCTHIVGECPHHKSLTISRHNAACQLLHAVIRNTAKCGGTLHKSPGPRPHVRG